MKQLLCVLFLTISSSITTQTNTVAETYEQRYEMNDGGIITYKLTLNSDGTFQFHFYRKLICSICKEENQFGKGTWTSEGKLVFFSADKSTDLNDEFILNFNASKARKNVKSPRNKTAQIIPETIRFYESEIFWVKGMELLKVN